MSPQDAPTGAVALDPVAKAPVIGKKKVVIGVMAFAIMNFTTVVSLRGLPAEAEYGLTSIFYFGSSGFCVGGFWLRAAGGAR
jgi:hypothetical protein